MMTFIMQSFFFIFLKKKMKVGIIGIAKLGLGEK